MSMQVYNSQGNIYPDKNGGEPFLEIIENPKSRGFRFRYTCEGPSHGGIPGGSSDKNKKTFPAVRICNYQGYARIVVQLVTNEENPRLHPHSLVGKQCQNGICTVQCGPKDMTATFPNLGIQHVTKKNVATILEERYVAAEMQLSSINDGFPQEVQRNIKEEDRKRIASKAQSEAKSIDLAVVRLMFIAYLPDSNGAFTIMLKPVISDAIYDSKAPNAATLKICRMDCNAGSASGGDEVYLLCDKVQKDDIQVRFFEEDLQGNEVWEGYGNFCPTDVHRQFAIVFRTPPYKDQNVSQPVNVQVQLKRRSDQEVSDSRPFTFLPNKTDLEMIERKRRKIMPDFLDHIGGNGTGKGYPFSGVLTPMNINFQNNSNGTGGNGGNGSDNKVREARRPPPKIENPQKGPIDPATLFGIKQEPGSPVAMFNNHGSPKSAMSPGSSMSDTSSPPSVASADEEQFMPGTRVPMPKNAKRPTTRIPQIQFSRVSFAPSNSYNQQQLQQQQQQIFTQQQQQQYSNMQTVTQAQQYQQQANFSPQQASMSPQSVTMSPTNYSVPVDDEFIDIVPFVDQNQNPVQMQSPGQSLETINQADILGQAFQQSQLSYGAGSGSLDMAGFQDPLIQNSLSELYDFPLMSGQFMEDDFFNIESDAGLEKGQPPTRENSNSGDFGSAMKYEEGSLEDEGDEPTTSVSSSPSTQSVPAYGDVESDAAAAVSPLTHRFGNLGLGEPSVPAHKKRGSPVQGKTPQRNLNEIAQEKQKKALSAQVKPAVAPAATPQRTSPAVSTIYQRMSQALQDFSVSGDVRMLLIMQRKLAVVCDDKGDTLLHLAVIHDQLEVLSYLLDVIGTLDNKDEILNRKNKQLQTPLHIAAMSDNIEAVIDLLKFGADPLVADSNGNNVLHIASRHGNADVISRVFKSRRLRFMKTADTRNHAGLGCFHLATKAKMNARKCMYLLRDQHFNVDMPDTKSGRTALHYAVESNSLVVAGCLITECDANIDAATYEGYTALHLAASLGCVEVTTLLLACGANPDASTTPPDNQDRGEKPIDLAATDNIKDLLHGNGTNVSIDYESEAINEDDLTSLDPVLRLKLCKLLNASVDGQDWRALADCLAMEQTKTSIKGIKDPTDQLLNKYTSEHGTVVGLRSALMSIGRHDAVQLLNRALITAPCYSVDNQDRDDSAIGSMGDVLQLEYA